MCNVSLSTWLVRHQGRRRTPRTPVSLGPWFRYSGFKIAFHASLLAWIPPSSFLSSFPSHAYRNPLIFLLSLIWFNSIFMPWPSPLRASLALRANLPLPFIDVWQLKLLGRHKPFQDRHKYKTDNTFVIFSSKWQWFSTRCKDQRRNLKFDWTHLKMAKNLYFHSIFP